MPRQLEHQQISNIKRTFPVAVVCEAISDPRNVGMAFRICEAMGVAHLYLCGSTPTPPHKKIHKSARSTEQWLPFTYFESTTTALQDLKEKGYLCCGLEITDTSKVLSEFSFAEHLPLALVIGSEQHGISPATLEQLEETLHIPMYGVNTSMNVMTALSIGLYEIVRQLTLVE